MPADLIDEIGPAPDNSNKPRNSANMVMDNIDDSVYANFLDQEIIADTYSSLQRGTSRVRQHILALYSQCTVFKNPMNTSKTFHITKYTTSNEKNINQNMHRVLNPHEYLPERHFLPPISTQHCSPHHQIRIKHKKCTNT